MLEPSKEELFPLHPEAEEHALFPSLEELTALLPQYHFQSVIGTGGMGAVYLAREILLERLVAIKVLPVSVAANPEDACRFNNEARAMARLSHPNITAVFDYGQTTAGHLYLAMEYIEGTDLHWRTVAGEITPERARDVIIQLCDALQYAHDHGVIHRDIKPANILITPAWQVKVVDFGLARDLTMAARADESEYGTPDYTAPERFIIDAPSDHRADIYSLGVVIHEILTGQTPLAAGGIAEHGLPAGFAKVLSKCLMHEPAHRFQKASDVRAALLATKAAAQKKPVSSTFSTPAKADPRHRSTPPRPGPPSGVTIPSIHPAWRSGLVLAIAGVFSLAVVVWFVWSSAQPKPPPAAASSSSKKTKPPEKSPPAVIVKKANSPSPTQPPRKEDFDEMPANKAASPTVNPESSNMNKAIPTALVLAASASSVFGVDYKSQIMPIFKEKCYSCHSVEAGKEKGKVSLDTEEKLKASIGPGQHIIPGEPEKSTMLTLCKLPDNDEEVMPPKGKNRLTPAEITLLESWIKEGANIAGGDAAPMAATTPAPAAAAPTSWTSNDGKTIEATFVALAGDQITLRMTGSGMEYTFPLSRLSAESQAQAKAAGGQ